MNYCLGFVLDVSGQNVLLIEKARPHWQAGQLNGIGGKLEGDETSHQAMVRECEEESGLLILNWASLGQLSFPGGAVDVFYAHADIFQAQQRTDEALKVVNMTDAIMGRYVLVDDVGQMLSKLYNLLQTE